MNALWGWFAESRWRQLAALLGITGSLSVVLQRQYPDESWSLGAQTALVLLFLAGVFVIFSGVFSPNVRRRLAFALLPALGAVGVGLFIPGLLRLFLGAAVGWVLVSQMLLRDTEKREYKLAIKAMRKNDYASAIDHMTALIKREAQDPAHYGFRAQLHRLNNDTRRAEADYKKVLELDPDSALGANGLAEISLQQNKLVEARAWAERAYQKAPADWVALYNLGMISERQGDDPAALSALHTALDQKIPESRHRLLTLLWLARIYHRGGDTAQRDEMIEKLRQEKKGVKEWGVILESKEAASLRGMLQEDVRQAQALFAGKTAQDVF